MLHFKLKIHRNSFSGRPSRGAYSALTKPKAGLRGGVGDPGRRRGNGGNRGRVGKSREGKGGDKASEGDRRRKGKGEKRNIASSIA